MSLGKKKHIQNITLFSILGLALLIGYTNCGKVGNKSLSTGFGGSTVNGISSPGGEDPITAFGPAGKDCGTETQNPGCQGGIAGETRVDDLNYLICTKVKNCAPGDSSFSPSKCKNLFMTVPENKISFGLDNVVNNFGTLQEIKSALMDNERAVLVDEPKYQLCRTSIEAVTCDSHGVQTVLQSLSGEDGYRNFYLVVPVPSDCQSIFVRSGTTPTPIPSPTPTQTIPKGSQK